MTVRAVASGKGRVRTGRVGAQGPGGGGGVSPAFQTDFSSLPTWVSLSRATTGTRFNSSGVLVTEAVDAPRFDYAFNGSAWVAAGLMDEEQRTNLITQSIDLSNAAWSRTNLAAVTAVTGIDGTSSAFKLVPNVSTSIHRVVSNTFGSVSSPFMVWAIVTASGYNQIALRESAVSGASAVFSLASGGSVSGTFAGFGSPSVSNAAIASLGSGRFLISCLFSTSSAVTPNIGIYVLDGLWSSGDPNSYNWAGDGTSGIVVECPQAEVGGFRTSYIPTTSAAVTRSADIAQLTGTALTALQASAASIIVENDTYANNSAFEYLVGLTSGDGSGLLYNGSALTEWNGSANLIGNNSTRGATDRAGLAFSGAGRSIVSNGGTVASDAGAVAGAAFPTVYLGSNGGGASFLNGHFRSLAIYTSRLSDADLQTKSVVGAAF